MNPFSFAKSAGYNPQDILSFFAKQIPGFEGKMSQAMAAGFTADQVLGYLQKQFKGAEVDKKTQRQLGPVFTDEGGIGRRGKEPDPVRASEGIGALAAGAVGGLAGAAIGGPVGAVQGALAGATSMGDVLKSYDRHVAEGGGLGLGDFLKAAVKGVGSAALAKSIMGAIGQLEVGEGQDAGLPQDAPGPETLDVDASVVKEGAPLPTGPSIEPDEAQQILGQAGVLSQLKTLSKNNPPEVLAGAARSILGKGRAGALEKRAGMQIEDLVGAAFPGGGIEEVQVEELAQPEAQPPKAKLDDLTTAAIGNTLRQGSPKGPVSQPKDRRIEPIAPIESSTLRSLFYDPNEAYAQALFQSGAAYEYFGVPQEAVSKVMAGSDTTTTEGESAFRAFYRGKDPSVGAAFDEYIKKGGYEYAAIEDEKIRDRGMRSIQKADRVHRTSNAVDTFAEIFEKAKGKQQIPSAEIQAVAADMDDVDLEDMVTEIRLQLRKLNKERTSQGKRQQRPTTKRIAKEIERRRDGSKRTPNNQKKAAGVRRKGAAPPS
jgi:hypothetical protein